MRIIGTNKSGERVDGVELVDLKTLLRESDIIAVTLPFTEKTNNLFGDKEFALMKDGVIVVTSSREPIINKQAVIKAVDTNKVFGFGMEAEIMQRIEKNDPYLQNPRIILTPHTAGVTLEAEKGYVTLTVENIKAFLDGRPIRVVT